MQPDDDQLVGGVVLRRPAIQSPNFVTGVSGWSINIDGSAEFNNGTVRGTLVVGTSGHQQVIITVNGLTGEIQIYDASGNLVGRWNGSNLQISPNINDTNSLLVLIGPSNAGLVLRPGGNGLGQIFQSSAGNVVGTSVYDGTTTHTQGKLALVSPLILNPSGSMLAAEIDLTSTSDDGTTKQSNILFNAQTLTGAGPLGFLNEAWTNLTLANLFTNRGAGFPLFGYIKVVSPPNSLLLLGQIKSGATVATGTQIATMPAGYRPTTEIPIATVNGTTGAGMVTVVQPGGAVKLFGTWANGDIIDINGLVPLDR